MSYFDTLYTVSYQGLPFSVLRNDGSFGRRFAQHKYPWRNTDWQEDMGKRPREFQIEGRIVGDDVAFQLAAFVAVCEINGSGILIHPTLGIQSVTLLDFKTRESFDTGREIRLMFTFKEAGQRVFPSLALGSGSNTQNAAGNLGIASTGNFIASITGAIGSGAQAAIQASTTVGTLAAVAGALVKNASNVAAAASSISGPFGRYAGGATGSSTGSITGSVSAVTGTAAQVTSLISGAAIAQGVVSSSGSVLKAIAGAL